MTIKQLIDALCANGVDRNLEIAINTPCDDKNWYGIQSIQSITFDDEVCIFDCDL